MTLTGRLALALTIGLWTTGALADEVDDLLAKRQGNFGKLKRMRAVMEVETERPAIKNKPAKKVRKMKYALTLKHRNRLDPDPARRFDTEMEMLEPIQLHLRVENGQYSFLTASGKWVSKGLPPSATEFLAGLSDRHAGDAPGLRNHFNIQRLKAKDNLWGTKKGLTYTPKGKSKLYFRKDEVVDAETGQVLESELYDEKGKLTQRMKVTKLGNHNGIYLPDEMETESFPAVGKVWQRTKMAEVSVETE